MGMKRAMHLRKVEDGYRKAASDLQDFQIGDLVDVHQWILEGVDTEGNEKKRIQLFNGTVIGRRGDGLRETFTVRRIVQGEGVERNFPLHSPKIAKVVVKRTGRVRRAKLYYLRDRVGKATRLRERKKGLVLESATTTDATTGETKTEPKKKATKKAATATA